MAYQDSKIVTESHFATEKTMQASPTNNSGLEFIIQEIDLLFNSIKTHKLKTSASEQQDSESQQHLELINLPFC